MDGLGRLTVGVLHPEIHSNCPEFSLNDLISIGYEVVEKL
jgi:hypothetical protein